MHSRTRVVFGAGALRRLPELASELGFRRTLLVTDPGLVAAGHAGRAAALLALHGIDPVAFHAVNQAPDSATAEAGAAVGRRERIDSVIALGGGSSMGCAKGVNLLLTNGGTIRDYQGYGKATRPLLPMLAVPTTAGTGSEILSYALLSEAGSREKLCCGDPGAAFKVAILDPELTLSQPRQVTALSGLEAIAHAVEAWVTSGRNAYSDALAGEAGRRLIGAFERVLEPGLDLESRASMQLGAHLAGAAVEASSLGAAHACAHPLTSRFGASHGLAVALMLPSVVRWNAVAANERYAAFLALVDAPAASQPAEALAARLEALAASAGLPARLSSAGISEDSLELLAKDAAAQATGRYNPRRLDLAGARELYRMAF